MGRLREYIEMAYRGGESYSGRDLLSRSALGQWLYRSGIRDKNVFYFTRQRTVFNKEFDNGRLQMQANISKSDPTLKTRLLKLLKDKAPEVLKDNGGDFYFLYGWLRVDGWQWPDDDLDKKNMERQAEKIRNILNSEGWDFEFDPEYGSFTFPSKTTFNNIAWYWTPSDVGGERKPTQKLKSLKKTYGDDEYATLIKEVHNSNSVGKLPTEVRAAITQVKVIK